MIQSDPIWSNLIQSDPIWTNLFKFDPIWTNLIQFIPIWSSLINLIQFDQVWSNLFYTDKNIIPIYLFLVKTSKKWNLYSINLEARFCQNCLVFFQKLEEKFNKISNIFRQKVSPDFCSKNWKTNSWNYQHIFVKTSLLPNYSKGLTRILISCVL